MISHSTRFRTLATCTIFAMLMWPRPGAAQQAATVSGSVTNSLNNETVANATVTIEELGRQARTGADGRFSIPNVPAGQYHLLARAEKFAPRRSEISVTAATLTTDVALDPEIHFSEVLSVSPDARNQFESFQPTAVLAGQELDKALQGTLGATLENAPGVAVRSLGPGPARPVIRGLDGDRVLILQDGQRMGDLSSQSGDHGVNVNPGAATRIEVVRGPATLLYGANAIGGLVNVLTDDIPKAPVSGAHGIVSFDAASAAGEAGGAGDVTVGNGRVALQVNGSGRRAGDYDTPEAEIPNSFSRGGFAGIGLSITRDNGYFGGNFAYDRTHYGVPLVEAGETNLDPRRRTFTLRGERRGIGGFVNSIRGSLGVRRYRHDELNGEEIATSFKNDTTEFDILAGHSAASRLKGSVGFWALTRSFATEGEESLSPAVDQKGFAGFVYEEATVSPHVTIQFGGRIERADFDPAEDEPARDFTNFSGSAGLLVHPTEQTTLAFSLARAARNPALEELYFHGPHPGNFQFENGDADLEAERATGFDLSLRWRGTRSSGELTYFFNNIKGFIFREFTGAIEDDLPEIVFTAGDGRLQGIESHLDVTAGIVGIEGGLDYVHGELTSEEQPMPRMPPLRGRLGVRVQKNAFQAGADAVFTSKQDRIFTLVTRQGLIGETPTESSQLLKLFASYSFGRGAVANTITARLDNATNELYHNHLNFLKDLVPEVGRNFKVIYSVRF
jgi:iron complex outermembrane receptor protein